MSGWKWSRLLKVYCSCKSVSEQRLPPFISCKGRTYRGWTNGGPAEQSMKFVIQDGCKRKTS